MKVTVFVVLVIMGILFAGEMKADKKVGEVCKGKGGVIFHSPTMGYICIKKDAIL